MRRIFFPTAATQLILISPGVLPADLRPCTLLGKETEGFPIDKILRMPLHVRCLWSNLVTWPSRPKAQCLHYLLPPPRMWDQFLIFRLAGLVKIRFFTCTKCYCSFIPQVYTRNHYQHKITIVLMAIFAIACTFCLKKVWIKSMEAYTTVFVWWTFGIMIHRQYCRELGRHF